MIVDTDEFIKSSSLEVLVPEATEVQIEELFSHKTENSDNVTSTAERRGLLYFGMDLRTATSFTVSLILRYVLDESITAYILLRTPNHDEASLKAYLSRLAVSLEVQACGFPSRPSTDQNTSNESSPSRNEDTLWSGSIDTSQHPVMIPQRKEERHSTEHVLAIWKITLPLSRPRMRLQSPTIVFKPTAMLRPSKEEVSNKSKDPYLPSGVPASTNLLESLKSDPATQGATPRLSAVRLSRISPVGSDADATNRTIMISPQKAFRALPAISSRVRYSRANGRVGKPSIIASLDIETAPFSNEIVNLTAVDMVLSDGSAEDLGKSLLQLLPLRCQPKDNPIFLFRLTPHETTSNSATQTSARTVLVTVHATVLVSSLCQPKIEMRWKTGVDFATALNPTYGAPGQSMQRQRRPNNLSRTLSNPNLNNMPAPIREPDLTSEGTQKQQRAVSVSDFGVSITFTAPRNVHVGQPFSWDILVVNRSNKPRQLALTVLPKQNRGSTTGHKSQTPSVPAINHGDPGTVDAVIDERSLYAMQGNGSVDRGEVISLSTDVKIGPLNPESCIDAELKLLPLARGYLQLEAVRLIDLVSNESADIRDLPDIIAEEAAIKD